MENKKLSQEPAFPCEIGFDDGEMVEMHQNGNTTALHNGMSKRFYAACAAMQGLLANPYWASVNTNSIDPPQLVKKSLEVADELLKQEFDDEN